MKTAEEILKEKGVSLNVDGNEYLKYGLTLNKIKSAMEEYASQALAELKAENEELKRQLKEIANIQRRFARWAIINAVIPFDKKDEYIYIESGKAFKDVDELFEFWDETINK